MGRVLELHAKERHAGEHGLPKAARPSVQVEAAGVVGDYNHYRQEKLHGDLDSAVLLLPSEVLHDLRSEGWPVRPGDLGENITTEGIPNDAFAPGTTVRVGGAELRVTRACDPCDNLFALPYVGRQKGPAFLKTTLGRRGWYARVLVPGTIQSGDSVVLLPPARNPA